MPKASPIQTNFTAGEISPLLAGRIDLDKYANGVKTMINMLPTVHGPVTRRSGTRFVEEIFNPGGPVSLIPFQFSVQQAYVIEVGDRTFRFYTDNGDGTRGLIFWDDDLAIEGMTYASPAVVTITGHGLHTGQLVFPSGLTSAPSLTDQALLVDKIDDDTFRLKTVSGSFISDDDMEGAVDDGALSVAAGVETPYAQDSLFDGNGRLRLSFAQSADVLYLVHADFQPRKLSRFASDTWQIDLLDFNEWPYLAINSDGNLTLTPGALTGSTSLSASADLFVVGRDEGRVVRYKKDLDSVEWGWARIESVNSATSADITIESDFNGVLASTEWRLGAWYGPEGLNEDGTAKDNNYPSSVTFHQDRLFFSGGHNSPQRIDASRTGDYLNFAPSDLKDGVVVADHALAVTLNANDVNAIQWLADDEKGLFAGAVGGEWIIKASSSSAPLGPENVLALRPTRFGSASLQPVIAPEALLFLQRAGRKIRELAFVFERDGFAAPDLTLLAEHITRVGVKAMAFQQESERVVWVLLKDGQLIGMTYERGQDVIGWHRHILGGSSDIDGAAPIIEGMTVLPSPDGARDQLWLAVRRWINGSARVYMELVDPCFDACVTPEDDAFFVDCGLTKTESEAPFSSLSGLAHLEGELVSILADGAVVPPQMVGGGQVTLPKPANKAHVGLAYRSTLTTLPLEAGAADGTAQGKTKRIHRVTVRLSESLGLKVGPEEGPFDVIPFRGGSDPMDKPPPLFSGDVTLSWPGGYEGSGSMSFIQDQPLPFTLIAVMPQMHTYDSR